MAGAPMRAEPELAFDGGRHHRMRVTNDEGAVPAEVVAVLVAGDVPLATAAPPRPRRPPPCACRRPCPQRWGGAAGWGYGAGAPLKWLGAPCRRAQGSRA